ncbi:EAL domain-containing protein [Maridesulfovibrio sp.]|uniref:putative bifunctional diguanylate cyclase/phosphodiesterase n=1 Tax=Maridesulfovibrio sp. TaxID=2795000 RepID=UPI002A18ADCC|nr:EAL domain-containing protein [Maridesulfovibrio sp.]
MHNLNEPDHAIFFACLSSGLILLLSGIWVYIRQIGMLRTKEPLLYRRVRKSFFLLIGLIASFVAGYSIVLMGETFHYRFDFNSIFGPILCLGSIFVFATAYLTVRVFGNLLKSREALKRMAYRDYMTGLPNRRMLTEQIQSAMDCCKEDPSRRYSVVFLDMLNFKRVNDSFGHYTGDNVLVDISSRLSEAAGRNSVVCRIGGDDFVILLRDIDSCRSLARLTEIREKLSRPYEIGGVEFKLDVSYGMYIHRGNDEELGPDEIINRANIAMRRSKQRGKNILSVFTRSMYASSLDIIQFESDFNAALQHDQFEVVYQPQYDIQGGIFLIGFEALVRWHHPERGLVSPAEFIPMAEETGLIVRLDRHVMEKACSMWSACMSVSGVCRGLHLSVNMSAKNITEPALVKYVSETIERNGIPPGSLYIELTESAFVADPGLAAAKLRSLLALGVHCSIDDFGTGYSSLAYLSTFPARSLKIDKSFIDGLESGGDGKQLVDSIISLAHGLGMKAVAEGVETGNQLAILRELGCDTVQGFYLGRPMPGNEAEKLVLCSDSENVSGQEE